jgi:hypothetical protein
MVQLTGQFQQCSQQVIAIEQALAGPLGQPQAAELLRSLQENEREKLQLTLSLQALKAAHEHQRFSWQAEEGADAAGVGWPGHVCGVGCSHQGPADEPTQVPGQPHLLLVPSCCLLRVFQGENHACRGAGPLREKGRRRATRNVLCACCACAAGCHAWHHRVHAGISAAAS